MEHALRGKSVLHTKICEEFVGVNAEKKSVEALARWDRIKKHAGTFAQTAEGKARRAVKKARKTRLLLRQAMRAGSYTYVTSDERAAKAEADETGSDEEIESEAESDHGAETETDTERETM